jgi:hypothetical protein
VWYTQPRMECCGLVGQRPDHVVHHVAGTELVVHLHHHFHGAVRLGIEVKHSTPYHPQTCGKVERLHQTLKRYLRQQAPAQSLAHLQLQLDIFRQYYNQQRPHRALGRQTPLVVFNARLKARPSQPEAPTHFRVRRDRIDSKGKVTLRYLSKLRHIPVGAAHRNRKVLLLVAGADEARQEAARAMDRALGQSGPVVWR